MLRTHVFLSSFFTLASHEHAPKSLHRRNVSRYQFVYMQWRDSVYSSSRVGSGFWEQRGVVVLNCWYGENETSLTWMGLVSPSSGRFLFSYFSEGGFFWEIVRFPFHTDGAVTLPCRFRSWSTGADRDKTTKQNYRSRPAHHGSWAALQQRQPGAIPVDFFSLRRSRAPS